MHKLDQIELQLDWSQLPYSEYLSPVPQEAAQPDITKKAYYSHQPLTFFAFITLGLPWPILTFSNHILPMVYFFFFFFSFRAPLSTFASFRPICLFHGPVIHYFCRLGLMDFLSIYQLFSVRDARLLLSTWTSKMAINTNLAF